MPSAEDTEQAEETEETVTDEAREALLEVLTAELGDVIVGSHLRPGDDLWIRVTSESWPEVADYLRNRQRFRFFDWLSAIDWMPSPYGRSLTAAVDDELEAAGLASSDDESDGDDAGDGESADTEDSSDDGADDGGNTGTGADGYTGGATRFQMLARVYNLTTRLGLTIKADIDETMTVGTWVDTYPGAAWHEREASEMFGITFVGNPDSRNLYLPGDFEGHPMRKDFPLMARLVKPWPGIVDVEPMPEVETPGASTENPEDTQ